MIEFPIKKFENTNMYETFVVNFVSVKKFISRRNCQSQHIMLTLTLLKALVPIKNNNKLGAVREIFKRVFLYVE